MKKAAFAFFFLFGLSLNAQIEQPAQKDSVHRMKVNIVKIKGRKYKEVDGMIMLGDDPNHTVFVDKEEFIYFLNRKKIARQERRKERRERRKETQK